MSKTTIKLLLSTIAGLALINVIVWWFTEPIEIKMLGIEDSFSWSTIAFYISCIYFIFSFRFWGLDDDGNFTLSGLFDSTQSPGYISTDEIGLRLRFGEKIGATLENGLPFVPLLVTTLRKLTLAVQQKEFPDEPGKIDRGEMKGDDGDVITDGFSPPERITFRTAVDDALAQRLFAEEYRVTQPVAPEAEFTFVADAPDDGLAERVTAEVVPVVRWRIKREEAINFVKNIGSIEEANRQIEDEMFSVLQRLLPNMSVGQAKQNFRWISAILHKAVIDRTATWGIEVETAFLKAIRLNHSLNAAIAEKARSGFEGHAARTKAILVGEGDAQAARDLERETLLGRAAGLKQLAAELGIQGEDAIAQFVAGQVAEGDNAIILGDAGFSQLTGLATALTRGQNPAQANNQN